MTQDNKEANALRNRLRMLEKQMDGMIVVIGIETILLCVMTVLLVWG